MLGDFGAETHDEVEYVRAWVGANGRRKGMQIGAGLREQACDVAEDRREPVVSNIRGFVSVWGIRRDGERRTTS